MQLLHISDTHGLIPQLDLDEVDIVVHSGDFLPNKTRGHLPIEEEFQVQWMRDNRGALLSMPRDRVNGGDAPFLICRGNHDFINPAEYLPWATDLSSQVVEVQGVKFFGHPYTPWFTGEWWGELNERQETHAMEGLLMVLERDKPDVLVSHGPMFGVLDKNSYGQHCGSTKLRDLLMHVTSHLPKVMLHGHIHESAGRSRMTSAHGQDIRIYNSATTAQLVTL